jgi:hypothetical protein
MRLLARLAQSGAISAGAITWHVLTVSCKCWFPQLPLQTILENTILDSFGSGLDLQQLLRFTVEESDSEIGMNPAILFPALFSWVHPSQI